MARMQFYHKFCFKLRNGKYDVQISKETSKFEISISFIHESNFYITICWYLYSPQMTFEAMI